MTKIMFASLIALFAMASFASAQDTKVEADSQTKVTGRVVISSEPQTVDVNVTPIYKQGTKRVSTAVRKPAPRPTGGYRVIPTQTVTGYKGQATISGSTTTATVEMDSESLNRVIVEKTSGDFDQLYANDAALDGRVGNLERFKVSAESEFKQLYANDKALSDRMGANERLDADQQKNLDYLNKKKDKTRGFFEWFTLGAAVFGDIMGVKNSIDISRLKRNQNTTIINNGGGGCWQNGRNRCGGGGGCYGNNCGGGCRGSNCCYPMMSASSDMYSRPCGVYNPPRGGNCLVRVVGGNCNYNNGDCYSGNCGAGGPSRVPNGSGYGNGNFTGNGGNNFSTGYNGSSQIFLGGNSNNSSFNSGYNNGGNQTFNSGGYNQPRANNGGVNSAGDNSGVIFH